MDGNGTPDLIGAIAVSYTEIVSHETLVGGMTVRCGLPIVGTKL